MAEASQYAFSYKEVVEALIRKQDVHDGLWALNIRFGMQATNFGPNESDLKPTVILPLLEIGIQKVDKENNLTVDAARVNPLPLPVRSSRQRPS